jgi:hypothetical protein
MTTKYLDSAGLSYFWGKIKTYVTNAIKVTGVKGSAESSYRTGNVNITASNVGAQPTLVSGTNIKTINGESILGNGDLSVATEPAALTVTLTAAGWVSNAQTVTVTGVTANNTIIVAPAPSSIDDYTAAGIKCTAQAANALTFECSTAPETAISVNVLVYSGSWVTYYSGASAPDPSLGVDGDIYLKA